MIKKFSQKNRDKLRAVVLFGSYKNEKNAHDLDYLVIMKDNVSLFHVDDLTKKIFLKTGVVSDASCMYESEINKELTNDFMLYDVIHNSEIIYDDGIIRKLRSKEVDLKNADREMIKVRRSNIQKLKETVLENLHIILYAGFYKYLYQKTGGVIPMREIDSTLLKYGNGSELINLGNHIIQLKKGHVSLSFAEINGLEMGVYDALNKLGVEYGKKR